MQALVNFMDMVNKTMLEALADADLLFWEDKLTNIRSQYTLDYCLTQGIKLAVTKLPQHLPHQQTLHSLSPGNANNTSPS